MTDFTVVGSGAWAAIVDAMTKCNALEQSNNERGAEIVRLRNALDSANAQFKQSQSGQSQREKTLASKNCDMADQINRLKNAVARGNAELEAEVCALTAELNTTREKLSKIENEFYMQIVPGDYITWGLRVSAYKIESIEGSLVTLAVGETIDLSKTPAVGVLGAAMTEGLGLPDGITMEALRAALKGPEPYLSAIAERDAEIACLRELNARQSLKIVAASTAINAGLYDEPQAAE